MNLNISPEASEALYHHAFTYYKQGQYQEAEPLFQLLTVINTRQAKYWMGLGACCQMKQNYSEAIKSYELAVAITPEDPRIHIHASDCFFAMGQSENGLFALECAERAAQLHEGPESQELKRAITWLHKVRKGMIQGGCHVEQH